MKKLLDRTTYIFTPGIANAGTIRFLGDAVPFESIQLVTNLTRGVVVYQFNSPTRGAAGYNEATNTLTLDLDTSTQSATDILQVVVDAPEDTEYAPTQIAAIDPSGYPILLRSSALGGLVVADSDMRIGRLASLGTVVQFETTGYQSISVQLNQGLQSGGVWTVTFQVSNDNASWVAVSGWPALGAAAPVSTANAAGQWIFPALGRFFRVQITSWTSGQVVATCVLRSQPAFFPMSSPSIAANSTVSVSQIAGTATVTAGVAGLQAIGGNIAVGAAPTANPVPIGGWDGTNTRRILTDAVSGGVVLGSSATGNGQTLARINQTATTPAASQIKATAGRLTMVNVCNQGNVAGFLHLYNANAVTLGTTADALCIPVPPNVSAFSLELPDGGLFFSSGIGAAFTAGSAAADNTAFGSAPNLTLNYAFL